LMLQGPFAPFLFWPKNLPPICSLNQRSSYLWRCPACWQLTGQVFGGKWATPPSLTKVVSFGHL
jgi:hypothetical protein